MVPLTPSHPSLLSSVRHPFSATHFSGHCFRLIPASGSFGASAFPVPPFHRSSRRSYGRTRLPTRNSKLPTACCVSSVHARFSITAKRKASSCPRLDGLRAIRATRRNGSRTSSPPKASPWCIPRGSLRQRVSPRAELRTPPPKTGRSHLRTCKALWRCWRAFFFGNVRNCGRKKKLHPLTHISRYSSAGIRAVSLRARTFGNRRFCPHLRRCGLSHAKSSKRHG
jgi:hypothetical protein